LLVLGAEGDGVSRTINAMASHRVIIPPMLDENMTGKYPFNMIDSLNVGACASIILHHFRQQRL